MRPVRVLHLIKTLELGGAETNLRNLVRVFDERRVETHVGYSFGGPIEGDFTRAGARLFKYADHSRRIASLSTVAIVARIAGYIRRNRIDIVHTHNFNAHVWGAAAAKLAGASVIEHVHDFRYMPPDEYRRRRGTTAQYRFAPKFARWADRIVVLTASDARVLESLGVPAARIVRIPNGIPLEEPSERDGWVKARLGVGESEFLVFTAARLAPEKNVDLLVRAARSVVGRVPNAVFVAAGSGPEEASLRKAAAGLGERFRFPGFVADIRPYLAACDVFCLPSFLELHSIALLEALSAGAACVVSAGTGCHDEFLRHGENALLFDPFDDAGWADGIVSLLHDPGRRRAMGEKGRRLCLERFDIRHTARAFEDLYGRLRAEAGR